MALDGIPIPTSITLPRLNSQRAKEGVMVGTGNFFERFKNGENAVNLTKELQDTQLGLKQQELLLGYAISSEQVQWSAYCDNNNQMANLQVKLSTIA